MQLGCWELLSIGKGRFFLFVFFSCCSFTLCHWRKYRWSTPQNKTLSCPQQKWALLMQSVESGNICSWGYLLKLKVWRLVLRQNWITTSYSLVKAHASLLILTAAQSIYVDFKLLYFPYKNICVFLWQGRLVCHIIVAVNIQPILMKLKWISLSFMGSGHNWKLLKHF